MPDDSNAAERVCTRCGERQPIDNYYFVSKKKGTRRGQCKACMSELKAMQKDPAWLPSCARCGTTMERFGPGRRLCATCFDTTYDLEDARSSGSHRIKLKPCSACGVKRLRGDHVPNTSLCAVCRSVPQSRRKRLRDFNMTPREFIELLESQRYRCAICGRKPSGHWNIDHQHMSPRIIRGATCGPCNSLLGMARDNPTVLQSAALYLYDPPAQKVFPGRETTEAANRTSEFSPLRRAVRYG